MAKKKGIDFTLPDDDDDEVIEAEVLTDEQLDLARVRPVPPPKPRAHAELAKPVGADGELSGLDRRLLEMAAAKRSPEEMGEELSMPPARAAQRVREILSSRDWLSRAEEEALLIQEMTDLKESLKRLVERFDDAEYLHGLDPRYIAMLSKVMGDLMKAVEQRRKAAQSERISIRSAHAKLVVVAIERAFTHVSRELRMQYAVDEVVLRDLMEEALPKAIASLQENTDGEVAA